MAEAHSAVEVVSGEASVEAMAVCLRHAQAAHLSDRARRAASGRTRILDLKACGAALGTAGAGRWLRGGHRVPRTVTRETLLLVAAMALDQPFCLPGTERDPMEAHGNRSGQIARLLLVVVRREPPPREVRLKRGTRYPSLAPSQPFIAHSGFQISAAGASG